MARQPFFGQGPGPLIARMDMNAATAVGREYGKAFREIGQAAGSAANAFIERKNEKKRVDSSKNAFMQLGYGADVAAAMAKDPDVQNAVMKKEALDNQMKIAKMNNLTSRATAGAARSQEAAKMEEEQRRFKQAEQSATNIAKFNLTRPDLPITEETPAAFLPELDPDPFVGPPTTYQGQAPAVAQLPESFQPQGAQVVDAVQSGRLSPLEGNRIMDSIQGQAMAERKAGPTRSEILAREKFEYEKAEDAEENKPLPPADPVYKEAAINAIDSAIEKSKGFFATGITGQALQGFASTDARDLAQAISTVEAAVGFDRLQEMRDSSKTGGALGAINTKELELLSNSLGSLDPLQKPETLRKNLESIKEKYVKILKSVEAEKYAFENDITFKTPKEAMDFVDNFNAPSPQQPTPQSRDELLKQEADLQKRLNERLLNNPPVQQFRGI